MPVRTTIFLEISVSEHEKLRPLSTLSEGKMVKQLWKIVWTFLKNLNIKQSHNPLLCICIKKLKSVSQEDFPPMFTVTLFTIAKIWKKLKMEE
jgi:hypothetical protein